MKSIDVFCHLMPQKYAELAMNESPNKSHMFVRALKMQAMSDMEYRKQVMEGFEGYKQIQYCITACGAVCRAGQITEAGSYWK